MFSHTYGTKGCSYELWSDALVCNSIKSKPGRRVVPINDRDFVQVLVFESRESGYIEGKARRYRSRQGVGT